MPLPLLAAAGIGMGVSALGRLLGGGGQPQVTRTSLDPNSQAYIQNMRDTAMGLAGKPMGPLDPAFLQSLQELQGYGANGMEAANQLSTGEGLMNPYFNAMNPYWDKMRADALNSYNKTATAAGAFGARRYLGAGSALAGVDQAQGQAAANEFSNARNVALQRMQLGLNASGMAGNYGQWLTDRSRNYDMGTLALLNQGYGKDLWTETKGPPPQQGSWASTLLGGAMTGASFAGAPAAATAAAPAASFLPGYVPGGRPIQWPTFGGPSPMAGPRPLGY